MLKLKLQKIGRRHQPNYRLVVIEARSKLTGSTVEDLGFYNPFTKEVKFNKEKIEYWLRTGVQPTPTVHNLLVKHGIIQGPKVKIPMKKKEVSQNPETAPVANSAELSGTK